MENWEILLRSAFYHDFNTSPEQFSKKLKLKVLDHTAKALTSCSYGQISRSHFFLTAEAFLSKYSDLIKETGSELNIDARAIAGAIAWEYEENFWWGRASDKWQVFFTLKKDPGVGWGSIHNKAIREIRPNRSKSELKCLRLDAITAIRLVGEIMKNNAEAFYFLSDGIWINDNPLALSYFFNTGRVGIVAAERKLISCEIKQSIELDFTAEKMPKWICQNMERFNKFRTEVTPPMGYYVRVESTYCKGFDAVIKNTMFDSNNDFPELAAKRYGIELKSNKVDVSGFRKEMTDVFPILSEVWNENKRADNPVITSGNDGKHKANSLHYENRALDLRAKNMSDELQDQIANEIREKLGSDYDVLSEHNPKSPSGDHIHIEYDPD